MSPQETTNVNGKLKWSLPQEGKFLCEGPDLHVLTPYPLYVTSMSWSGEPWKYGSDWVPVGPLFHFQFRCDDATEPVEIDLPHIAKLSDVDVVVACMYDDELPPEFLAPSQVKPGHAAVYIRQDARVGVVGRTTAVCASDSPCCFSSNICGLLQPIFAVLYEGDVVRKVLVKQEVFSP
ncbi:Hypp9227 [Branchiostoma lanceolatum]|uniref:Hypp9227 protein n=1 Tax=Branchiostoma lanceolatum TaxID=7740 RepID=A0A8J9ZF35_BRALA|nr:Hypp9227 [Branchiostoma lanceolatum]